MNEQKERMICFDIDQNKQKINHLMKKNKENENAISSIFNTIETNQADLNGLGEQIETTKSDLTAISESVSSLNTAVADLQAAVFAGESFEECFPKSYDKMRWNTNAGRNNRAVNGPFFFCCKEFSQVKLKFQFTLENQTTQTSSTVEFFLDDEVFYTDTHTWNGETTHDYEVEHTFTSKARGHMLMLTASTPAITNQYATQIITIKSVIMEIWGTNVEILSHRPDFQVFSSPTKVLMTTHVFDSVPRYSMQTPDSNLSFDQANFKTFCGDYWVQNNPIPCITSVFNDEGILEYSDSPSVANSYLGRIVEIPYMSAYIDITEDETSIQTIDAGFMGTQVCCDFALTNLTNATRPIRVSCSDYNLIWVDNEKESTIQNIDGRTDVKTYEITGTQRMNNTSNTAPECFVFCNADGLAYIAVMNKTTYSYLYPKTDLGYGTNPKVYALPDNTVEVFLKYGKDTKRILLEKDSEDPKKMNIISTQILPNIQGYWKCFNGAHFERVGDEIRFFPPNTQTHTKTLQLFY